MSDVRLVATNPEDSSLVPVACNSRGEMMIVEPTIEKISNDVEIEGDLTVTGTINGDNGGSGLPAPGPEGSILAIVDGQPAWAGKADLCAPPPPTGPRAILTSTLSDPGIDCQYQNYGIYSSNGELTNIEDGWDEAIRNLFTWENPTANTKEGLSATWDSCNVSLPARFDFIEADSMVFILRYKVAAACAVEGHSNQTGFMECTSSDGNVTAISNSFQLQSGQLNSPQYYDCTASFLIKRPEVKDVVFNFKNNSFSFVTGGSKSFISLHSWEFQDASTYLIQKLAKLEALREVVMTTDIDLSR
jgi:hypothetical protein